MLTCICSTCRTHSKADGYPSHVIHRSYGESEHEVVVFGGLEHQSLLECVARRGESAGIGGEGKGAAGELGLAERGEDIRTHVRQRSGDDRVVKQTAGCRVGCRVGFRA